MLWVVNTVTCIDIVPATVTRVISCNVINAAN